jgi:hypothetical protein
MAGHSLQPKISLDRRPFQTHTRKLFHKDFSPGGVAQWHRIRRRIIGSNPAKVVPFHSKLSYAGLAARFVLVHHTKTFKMYQMTTKYTK